MEISEKRITIREISKGYINNDEEGVIGYGGKLNIRPKYQREFVYLEKEKNAVIDTINKGFPLNTMYWVENEDGTFEIMDGQQRTISFCMYVNGDFPFENKFFNNLTETEKRRILDYECSVYICKGNDEEKLKWFEVINIAGKPLTEQELRNAIYTGPFITDAKRYFSKTGCPASDMGEKLLNGSAIRQDYLETAIRWINNGDIEGYMANHQHDPNANELWTYFKSVIDWVVVTFINYRKEMKGINWGELYNKYSRNIYDTNELEQKIMVLMMDDDVTNKKGVYAYIFDDDSSHLNIRLFTDSQKRAVYEKQKGICPICGKEYGLSEMEADHITPWSEGGKTDLDNCQMLYKECNRRKSNK